MDFSSSDNSGHMTTKVPFKIEVVHENVFPSKTLYPKIKWEGMGRGKSKAKDRLKSMCPKVIHPKAKSKGNSNGKANVGMEVKAKAKKEAKFKLEKETKEEMTYTDVFGEYSD